MSLHVVQTTYSELANKLSDQSEFFFSCKWHLGFLENGVLFSQETIFNTKWYTDKWVNYPMLLYKDLHIFFKVLVLTNYIRNSATIYSLRPIWKMNK